MKLDHIFKEFIHVIQENPDYIIGLLNEDRKVVSSSSKKRLDEIVRIDDNNKVYKIIINGNSLGYLWVNGPKDSITVVGNILFDSLKTRILYELNKELAFKSLTVDDQIIKELLKKDHRNNNLVSELMKKIQFNESLPRVSIYVVKDGGFDKNEIAELKYKINDKSTIYSLIESRRLLIFKSIPSDKKEQDYRDYLSKFVYGLIDWGLTNCYYSVGTIQVDPNLYIFSYENCLWIRENIKMDRNEPIFFDDNLFTYFTSKTSNKIASNVFSYYEDKASRIDVEEFVRIIDGLYLNDFNIKKTAEKLFIHKNTLLYKIKKYEEVFSINIRGEFQDKILVCLLANYFKENKSEK